MKDTVCLYSGGMDSFTLVSQAFAHGNLHSCLSFDYGQRHVKELEYAKRYCTQLGVPHHIIDLSVLKPHLLGSALTDSVDVPEGHYQAESMKLTVVPNRNMIVLSIAVAYAISHKLYAVRYGAHSGDHEIYPDCRPQFVDLMDLVAKQCDWHKVAIQAPFIHMNKADILEVGFKLELDYAQSWTCYAGRELACGKCGSCQERLEAFRIVGRPDPLEYQA